MDIQLSKIRCKHCGHEWHPRKTVITICAKCKRKLDTTTQNTT